MGLTGPANLAPGWAPWFVQTLVLLILLMGVYRGRKHLTDVIRQLEQTIGQTKELTQKLKASEARAQVFLQKNPLACSIQDAVTQRVLDVNEAFLTLFNAQRDDLIGQNPGTLFHDPADAKIFQSQLRKTGVVRAMNATGARHDGTTFAGQVFSDVVTIDESQLLISMVLDVTEQQKALRALERSEDRFAKAVNGSPMGMLIVRISNDRIVEVNAAQASTLGIPRSELLGEPSNTALKWVHETERIEFWQEMRGQSTVRKFDASLWTKTGQQIEAQMWADMIEIEGEASALIYVMNVTEERRRETVLIDLAKGISAETGELFFHSLVERMSETLRADLVLAGELSEAETVQSIAVHQDGEAAPNFQYQLDDIPCSHTMNTMGGCYTSIDLEEDFPNIFPEGDVKYTAYIGVPLRDVDGTDIGILKALWKAPTEIGPEVEAMMAIFASRCNAELVRLRQDRDIVALRETLEQRVAERTAQLEDLNGELDSFAYSVSHDLKTPLRSIEGFMHLLREKTQDRLDDSEHELMNKVMGASNRMAQLIKDLLALARVSQTELNRSKVNITAMAQEVFSKAREADPEREVDVRIEANLFVDCDPHLTRIALDNLIGNAWKYTRNTENARIDFGGIDTATGSSTLFIKDNGAGFDMERADRLFKAFNRLHGANEFEGSGIGLATVRRITDRHGGHISGEGNVGKGACFQFSFGSSELMWAALASPSKGSEPSSGEVEEPVAPPSPYLPATEDRP